MNHRRGGAVPVNASNPPPRDQGPPRAEPDLEGWADLRRELRRLRIEVGLLRREKAAVEARLAAVTAELAVHHQRQLHRRWWRR